MTDKQKLQQLFDAALKTPVANEGVAPKRAFPKPGLDFEPAPIPSPVTAPVTAFQAVPAPAPVQAAPDPATAKAVFEAVEACAPEPAAPALDKEAAEELGALLDERIAKKARRRKLELVCTLVVFFGTTGGTAAWFVQSPARMQAMREVIRDFRQYGDIKSMVAKYQEYIDKIAARNKQIDQASNTLGVDPTKVDHSDETMDAEMKQMMGKEGGKTLGERNKALQAAFGERAEQAGGPMKANVALKENESFNWK